MTLEVMICTMGSEGIGRVARMELPEVEGVSYLVSWQQPHGEVPPVLQRSDVKIITSDDRGLSVNRNHALDAATSDVLLVADDDLRYTASQLKNVIEAMERHPDVELATFRYEGVNSKVYPEQEMDITRNWPKNYYVTSFEIALRRESRAGQLRFDERFGVGAPLFHLGEEELLLLEARKKGIRCRYFPITITSHVGLTSGNREWTPGACRGMGAVIRRTFPLTCLPRIVLKAYRGCRARKVRFLTGIWYMLEGLIRS